MMRVARAIASAVLLWGLAGCAAPKLEYEGAYLVVRSRPATETATPAGVQRAGDPVQRFLFTAGDAQPRPLEARAEPTDRFGATWTVIEGELRELFHRVDAEGNVVLTAAIEHADRAISLFDPPLIVAYATLAPGATRTQQVRMRVLDRDRPRRLKEQGTVTQSIHFADAALLRRANGDLWTWRLIVRFDADLRQADVHQQTTFLVAPERGVYVEESEKTVEALGLVIRRDQYVKVRDATPDAVVASHRVE